MAVITWDQRLVTGIEEIDVQHRTLLDTLNRIAAAAGRDRPNRDELEGLLIFLRNFTLGHFELEQEFMARSSYPHEVEHRKLHCDLAAQLEAILDAFHKGTTALDLATLEYLDDWLQRHIQEEDVRLADFLKNAQAT